MAPESERAMKFRKKPVVVEARQFVSVGKSTNGEKLSEWIRENGHVAYMRNGFLFIRTLESNQLTGILQADEGDWIVRGTAGEFYPCKPDIFAATYDAAENSEQTFETSDGLTNPNEPTLTCSEVVERLATECLRYRYDEGAKLDRFLAIKILTEWRERRVQELEEALRGLLVESIVLTKEYLETVARGKQDWESVQGWDIARWKRLLAAKESAEKALANSEWREQIRKGAKHE